MKQFITFDKPTTTLMSFSIIAIKTGRKPQEKHHDPKYPWIKWDHLKVLSENTVFKLNNAYMFENNAFEQIQYKAEDDIDIFSIRSDKKTIPVSVQAIVGGNGSGKSSLVELIYWANYNIGAMLDLFEESYEVYSSLDFQLFYRTRGNEHFLLSFANGKIARQRYTVAGQKVIKDGKAKNITRKTELTDFFYSVVINYSHYSLNEQEVGSWVHPLFHKNDAYQTPLVLNPKREEKTGINIETERKLVSRRLQALTLEPYDEAKTKGSLRDFGNNKIAQSFELTFNPDYHLGPYHNLEEPKGPITQLLASQIQKIFRFRTQIDLDKDPLAVVFVNYILGKMVKMGEQYPEVYGQYVKDNKLAEETEEFLKRYLDNIRRSGSHIVFKAKGAILFLKYAKQILKKKGADEKYIIPIPLLSKLVQKIKLEEPFFVNSFMLTPPSFFKTDIRLSDKTTLDALSSGCRLP